MGLTDSEETVQVSKGQTPLRHCNRDRDVVWAAFGSGRSRRLAGLAGRLGVGSSNRRPIAYAALATGDAIGRLRLLAHGGETDVDCRPAPSSGISYDAELAAQLWDLSRSLTTVAVHRPTESFGKSCRHG